MVIKRFHDLSEGILADFAQNECPYDSAAPVVEHDELCPQQAHICHSTTVLGDLWLLGNHRLLCGDSTSPSDVATLLRGDQPNLMVTDPPYGVRYSPEWRDDAGIHNKRSPRIGAVQNDDCSSWISAWKLFHGNVAYVWISSMYSHITVSDFISLNFDLRSHLIWVKSHFALSRGNYHWQHEPCLYLVRNGYSANWTGARNQSTVWFVNKNAGDDVATIHGAQKPVMCMLRPMLNNSSPNDFVYEPFAGSGSTFIAAEKSDRKCLGMELSCAYCDIIITRWQNFSKKVAYHACGKSFSDITADRNGAI